MPVTQKGQRLGGRAKGTPNKRSGFSVSERLKEMGIDLIGEIIREIELIEEPQGKVKCWLQLLEYCDAKRKAIEVMQTDEDKAREKLAAMHMSELVTLAKQAISPKESKNENKKSK